MEYFLNGSIGTQPICEFVIRIIKDDGTSYFQTDTHGGTGLHLHARNLTHAACVGFLKIKNQLQLDVSKWEVVVSSPHYRDGKEDFTFFGDVLKEAKEYASSFVKNI